MMQQLYGFSQDCVQFLVVVTQLVTSCSISGINLSSEYPLFKYPSKGKVTEPGSPWPSMSTNRIKERIVLAQALVQKDRC